MVAGVSYGASDGTAEGTRVLKDIVNEDYSGASYGERCLTRVGQKILMKVLISFGYELWSTDGTSKELVLKILIAQGVYPVIRLDLRA